MKNTIFVSAKEVAEELGVSKATAYKMIRVWNEKLKEKGYTTVSGKISRKFYQKQFYGIADREAM